MKLNLIRAQASRFLLLSTVVISLSLVGCGKAATVVPASTLTEPQREAVLTSLAQAQSLASQGVISTANAVQSQGFSTQDVEFNMVSVPKASYDHGTQNFRYTHFTDGDGAAVETWQYLASTSTENIGGEIALVMVTDSYQKMAASAYTTDLHLLMSLKLFATNLTKVDLSLTRLNGTVTYTNGQKLTLINASLTQSGIAPNVTCDVNYPFSFEFDADGNGTKEQYTGTFVGTDLTIGSNSSNDHVTHLLASVYDSQGAYVGKVKLFLDGTIETEI